MIETAKSWIAEARAIAVLTGAGISAESGVPTFRGSGGLWREYRAEDLATPQAFARDPLLVWQWYEWRRGLIAETGPNAGHRALVELEQRAAAFMLITQNVDGLHDRAGSRHLLKLHGDIWTLRCVECATEWIDRTVPLPDLPPRCRCGAMARPGVVWFGEPLPRDVWRHAESAVRACDVLLVVGTSAVVYPAASLVPSAQAAGARVIEVNPEATPVSGLAACALRGTAGELLPELVGSPAHP